ncbi:MAG TPA: ABC transporter permease [Acidimicrobiia bacterium]|nr:ABC transporter permease [Acidimicrobiia bacterium]
MSPLAAALAENGPDSFIWWDWVDRNRDVIWDRTVDHLRLTVTAVVIGFVVALALAALSLRFRRLYGPITWVAGVLYTIPSLALFGLLIPLTGLGFRTALIALVSYTLLILVRNIVEGVDAVPDAVKEAADGMGFTRGRRFVLVELALATPAIVAGLRVASVTVVGLVTVTALVGEGGLGVLILDGLRRLFPTPIVVGTALSVVLALVLDVVFLVIERLLTPWARRSARA